MHTDVDVHLTCSENLNSGSQPPQLTSTTIEIMIPQAFMSHVYGENNSTLNQIWQVGLHILLLLYTVTDKIGNELQIQL